MKSCRPVTVTTTGQEILHTWATSAAVKRNGDLVIYDGWRQRAFYPHGQWAKYTVQPDRTRTPSILPRH